MDDKGTMTNIGKERGRNSATNKLIQYFDELSVDDLVEDGLHVNHQGYLKLSKKIKQYNN